MLSFLLALALGMQDEPADPFDWARSIDEADLSWEWGEFEFNPSGRLVLEAFFFGDEAPGVHVEDVAIRDGDYDRGNWPHSPEAAGRLQLFLEGRYRDWLEYLVEGRLDFTTYGDHGDVGARFEEYWFRAGVPAARLQAGRFSPPLGNFIPRHDPSKNPLTTWPLPYDLPTAYTNLGNTASSLVMTRDYADVKDWFVPVWREVYGTGVQLLGESGAFTYAVALSNSAPGTLPEKWDVESGDYDPPNLYLRGSVGLDISTRLGASWSRGPYEKEDAVGLPPGRDPGDFSQTLAGLDLEFASGDFDLFAEIFWTEFEAPHVNDLGLWSYYVEGKYTLLPGLFAAARFAQMRFGDVRDPAGESHRWDRDTTRWELGGGYFFTKNLYLKGTGQLNHHLGGREPDDHLLMIQTGLEF